MAKPRPCFCAVLLLLLSGTLWAPPASASDEEQALAARLTREATEFLDSVLGPGRARVLITVESEREEVQTQTEVTTPITKPAADEALLPGQAAVREMAAKRVDYFQKDFEKSSRTSGLSVKRLRVAVVLDKSIGQTQVDEVKDILYKLLRMEDSRGDDLSILRASLLPTWKAALLAPDGMRTAVLAAGAAAGALLVCLLAFVTVWRMSAALAAASAARRPADEGQLPPAPRRAEAAELDAVLLADEVPALARGLPDARGGRAPQALLGHRFDFLAKCNVDDLAPLLAKEPPEDLALFFGYLAAAKADLAARLFSSLPATLRAETSRALAGLEMADPERLAMLENRIRTAVEFGVQGPERLGQILSRMTPDEREGVMGDLADRDPAVTRKVERFLFPFERLVALRPEELQRVITAVPYSTWALALRGASNDFVEGIFAQLPGGAQTIIREGMEAPAGKENVIEARSAVLGQLYRLAAAGQVELRPDSEVSPLE